MKSIIILSIIAIFFCNCKTSNFSDINMNSSNAIIYHSFNEIDRIYFYCYGNLNSDITIKEENLLFFNEPKYWIKNDTTEFSNSIFGKYDSLCLQYKFDIDSIDIQIFKYEFLNFKIIDSVAFQEYYDIDRHFKTRFKMIVRYSNQDLDTFKVNNKGLFKIRNTFIYSDSLNFLLNEYLPDNMYGGKLPEFRGKESGIIYCKNCDVNLEK